MNNTVILVQVAIVGNENNIRLFVRDHFREGIIEIFLRDGIQFYGWKSEEDSM